MSCAIVGIGRTRTSRASGRSTLAMAAEACRAAVADSGLSLDEVNGMITFHANDSVAPLQVSWALGIAELEWSNALLGGGNLVADCLGTAAALIQSGTCRAVLVYRSLNGRSGHRFGTVTGPLEVGDEWQFTAPHGFLVPPQWLAMWARRHQAVYGSTTEDLGRIAVTQRAHAVDNVDAVAREPIDLDDYFNSRWVNDPFRVLDCAFEVDGAVAVLVVGEDLLDGAAKEPVWLAGTAASHSGAGFLQWDDMTSMYSRTSAPRLWKRTGLTAADIDVALMYDCFTYTVMATLEDYGFCDKGEVGAFFREGRATYGGDVVVNPHGGLLSEGYLHGMNHVYEAVLQLRHAAGPRQVPDAEVALVTAGAGPFGGANVLTATRP